MKAIRLILIFLVGVSLTYLTYKSKYQTFFFEDIIWTGLISIGLFIFLWTIIKDIRQFNKEKKFQNFSLTFFCILFISATLILKIKNNNNFNKPTLLKVFYNGDYNGTGIDFKADGTYIFDNSAIGVSEYFYGTYEMNGNKITMDKDTIDNITNLKYLEIRHKQSGGGEKVLYLYQVDSLGNLIERSNNEYRVIIDNRKNKLPLTSSYVYGRINE
ncbi:MAG: hypothetical protein FWF52_08210 [Candidatus Azobacteroides sp.]|nr:hypothetical protein [Candidatus Azobacteroides sp.]